jgi:hypothetical protein
VLIKGWHQAVGFDRNIDQNHKEKAKACLEAFQGF